MPASRLTSHVTGAPGAFLLSCLAPPQADLAVKQEGEKGRVVSFPCGHGTRSPIASQGDASHVHMASVCTVFRRGEGVCSNTLN